MDAKTNIALRQLFGYAIEIGSKYCQNWDIRDKENVIKALLTIEEALMKKEESRANDIQKESLCDTCLLQESEECKCDCTNQYRDKRINEGGQINTDFIKEFVELSKNLAIHDISLQIDKRCKTRLIISVHGNMYRGLGYDPVGEYITAIPLEELEKEENLTEFVYGQIKNTIHNFCERI